MSEALSCRRVRPLVTVSIHMLKKIKQLRAQPLRTLPATRDYSAFAGTFACDCTVRADTAACMHEQQSKCCPVTQLFPRAALVAEAQCQCIGWHDQNQSTTVLHHAFVQATVFVLPNDTPA
jgi:hypothetical protein